MAVPELTLGRIVAELRVQPKALGYYSNRIRFGHEFYPDPYPNWEINPTELKLKSPELGMIISVESGKVSVTASFPIDTDRFHSQALAALDTFLEVIVADEEIQPARLGLRPRFVLERSSFAELYSHFRSNTLRHEKSWLQMPPYSIRDLGFTNVYYGSDQDGLNLTTGVLTAEQAENFQELLPESAGEDLRIDEGCLLVDFDRYTTIFDDGSMEALLSEYELLEERANTLAGNVLRGY